MKALIQGLLFVFFAGLAITSCTWDEIKPQKVKVPDSVRFSKDIFIIFTSNCTGCHFKNGQTPDLSTQSAAYNNLFIYNEIDTDFPENSNLYMKITTGSMKDHATDTDRALILKWIQQGALNN